MYVHMHGVEDVRGGRLIDMLACGDGYSEIIFTYLIPRKDHTGEVVGYQAWYRRQSELFISEGEAVGVAFDVAKRLVKDSERPFPKHLIRVNAMFDRHHPERIWPGGNDYLKPHRERGA